MTNGKRMTLWTGSRQSGRAYAKWVAEVGCMNPPIEPTTANELLTRYRRWIDVGTWEWWHPNAGNAKARRRWRRRNLPNTQREAALAHEMAEFQRWCAGVYGGEEAKP